MRIRINIMECSKKDYDVGKENLNKPMALYIQGVSKLIRNQVLEYKTTGVNMQDNLRMIKNQVKVHTPGQIRMYIPVSLRVIRSVEKGNLQILMVTNM